jgi:hypothetical protein
MKGDTNPMHTHTENSRNQQPFFSKFKTFVLARLHEDGRIKLSGDDTELGTAVVCFLSPIHAAIDASFGSKSRMDVAMPVQSVARRSETPEVTGCLRTSISDGR